MELGKFLYQCIVSKKIQTHKDGLKIEAKKKTVFY